MDKTIGKLRIKSDYSFRERPLPLIICSVYLWIVFTLQFIAISGDNSYRFTPVISAVALVFSVIFSYIVLKYLSFALNSVSIEAEKREKGLHVFIIFLLLSLAVCGVLFYRFFPGNFTPDTDSQLSQAYGKTPYNDWHPFLNTLIFYALPIKLGLGEWSLAAFQMILFSVALAYLLYTMYKLGLGVAVVSAAFALTFLSRFLRKFITYVWKDNAMMIFIIVLMAYYFNIVFSKGEWLKKTKNQIVFALFTVLALKMRHNAVLFILPFVMIVFFYLVKNKKAILKTVAFLLIGLIVVRGMYIGLKVEKPDQRMVETIGLPLTVWCNVIKENPEALPEETRELMYSFDTKENYDKYYSKGDFNTIKYETIDLEKIDKLSYVDAAKITIQCLKYAPKESLQAASVLTSIVWGFAYESLFQPIYIQIQDLLFSCNGAIMIAELFVAMCLILKRRKSIIHLIPVFCYNYGTMLLLSSLDKRFFIFNVPIFFPLIIIMLKDKNTFKQKAEGETK
ncbi:MAG: DUF6020 family protein [Clostridiales bacterium]|nr:DUF6020 family protein [Clostridiales bacterium]